MTDRRDFLKQTATISALGTLPYPVEADERATKNTAANVAPPLPPTDIRSLTQHFNQPGGGIEPWMYVPKGNIAAISTEEHPSIWPADRTQRPPDTHDFQLLVVHLGNTGEFGSGLPQFAPYRTPETHLVWGRGDLAPTLNGDWKIPYFFQGSMPDAGPANPIHEFTVDYCVFLPCAPTAPFESFSDEFDVPGDRQWPALQPATRHADVRAVPIRLHSISPPPDHWGVT
jgi:hypothetical protein